MVLTDEDFDQLDAALEGSNAEPQEAPTQEPADEAAPVEASEPEQPEQEAEAVTPPAEEHEEFKDGHSIPYSRFKSLVDKKNEYQSQADSHSSRIAELEKQLEQAKQFAQFTPQQQQQKQEEEAAGNVPLSGDPDIDALRQDMWDVRVQMETQKVIKEVSAVAQSTGLEESLLYDVLENDPAANLSTWASHYQSRIAEIEEAAIARHLTSTGQAQVAQSPSAPAVPPEVGSAASEAKASGPKKIKNMDDAFDDLDRRLAALN